MQRLVPRIPPRILGPLVRLFGAKRFIDWSFGHYLQIAPPEFVNSANDQESADEQEDNADHPLGAERHLV